MSKYGVKRRRQKAMQRHRAGAKRVLKRLDPAITMVWRDIKSPGSLP